MPEFTIRPITTDDAAAYNAYRHLIADEPDNNVALGKGEYPRTVEQERERIEQVIADPLQQILLAVGEDNATIWGQCAVRGTAKNALRHKVDLGIDLAPQRRGQGVGNALMGAMIDWVRGQGGIQRIGLDVFSTNRAAISLYLKHGFMIEGCQRRAYFKDGHFVDAYIMGLLLD